MSDVITVYWGYVKRHPAASFDYSLSIKEPQPSIKEISFFKNNIAPHLSRGGNPLMCPAVIDSLKNTYYIPSPYNLGIEYRDNRICTTSLGQEFFDTHICLNWEQGGFFQLYSGYVFFTDEESLVIRQRGPSLSNTDISNKLITIEGQFDIGMWFRPFNSGYIFKEPGEVYIKKDQPQYYIDFLTQKQIRFKKFMVTQDISNIIEICTKNKLTTMDDPPSLKDTLKRLYSEFRQSKIKKRLLKLINENLLD